MPTQTGTFTSIGSTATPDWAISTPPATGQVYIDAALLFVQFCGLVACGMGIVKTIRYVTPGNTQAPPNLWGPAVQIIIGMFALVPDAVYSLVTDFLGRMGWM